jgi:transcriptional regulator with XRE-family HTH domain
MDNKEIFAYNLNFYMNENGKSRKDVADAIGVSYFTYTDWVKGKKYPRMDKVERLAKYFGIKISDLVEKKTIEKNPMEMAKKHAEMLKDEDILEVYEYFKALDTKKRKIVKDLVRSLAED